MREFILVEVEDKEGRKYKLYLSGKQNNNPSLHEIR